MTTSVHDLLFGTTEQKPHWRVARDLRRSESPNPDITRVPILPMSDRGRPDADGLYTQNQDRIDQCRDLGTHIWVRSIITTYRTKFPLSENTTAKYFRDEDSVFWCSWCGHSLRTRHHEEKKITVAAYFREIAPNTASYPGNPPADFAGWITSTQPPDAPIPHHDWEQAAFLKGRTAK